jgi:hypothetical protein
LIAKRSIADRQQQNLFFIGRFETISKMCWYSASSTMAARIPLCRSASFALIACCGSWDNHLKYHLRRRDQGVLGWSGCMNLNEQRLSSLASPLLFTKVSEPAEEPGYLARHTLG